MHVRSEVRDYDEMEVRWASVRAQSIYCKEVYDAVYIIYIGCVARGSCSLSLFRAKNTSHSKLAHVWVYWSVWAPTTSSWGPRMELSQKLQPSGSCQVSLICVIAALGYFLLQTFCQRRQQSFCIYLSVKKTFFFDEIESDGVYYVKFLDGFGRFCACSGVVLAWGSCLQERCACMVVVLAGALRKKTPLCQCLVFNLSNQVKNPMYSPKKDQPNSIEISSSIK